MMEKQVLVAFVLSLLVLFFFQSYFAPPPKPVTRPAEAPAVQSSDSPASPPIPQGRQEAPVSRVAVPAPSAPSKDIRVETPLYTAVFSNRGAVLKEWSLGQYLDQVGERGKPVEMVKAHTARLRPLGLGLVWGEGIQDIDIPFQCDREALILPREAGKTPLVFQGTTPEGVAIKKTFFFSPGSYCMDVSIEVTPPSHASAPAGIALKVTRELAEGEKSGSLGFTGPAAYVDGTLNEIKVEDLTKGNKTFSMPVKWAAYEEKYFLTALLPSPGFTMTAEIAKSAENAVVINCFQKPNAPATTGTITYKFGYYSGPKDIEILRSLGQGLEKAIDFGMFDMIAKPLLYTLKYLNKMTRNYGLAIIVLTLIIKIIFFPLTHQSYKSMKVMREIQPQMANLKKKYADDKEALNRELINLYRAYKVNPLGGCLPLVVQFPIFIAFYWVLLGSIELRHAPFFWWIKDLSSQDPYYITPVLMGGSMFILQKMSPTTADPLQNKMMLAMPVVFTFLFFKFPAGLVIYWLVSNLLQIVQQIYIDKRIA
jgi:YidC/Oxa1 family membrane protein insertase